MSQYNIGPKIGIEGEREFRAQISRINSEYRSMDSYLKALDQSMEKQGVTQDLLAQKSNAIQRQIALQNKAYAEYSAMLEKIKGLEGDHSDEITRYEGALLHTKNTLSELKFELSATEQAMADLASGISEIAAATASAESRISEYHQEVSRLNSEFDAAKSYTDAVGRNMATTGRSMEGLANQANGLYRQIDLQQQIFIALQSELREASGLYGDNSAEVLRLSASIENVKYTVSGLERELSKTEKAMDDVAHGIDDVGESADSAESKVLSFGDMLKSGIASGVILNVLEEVGEMIVDIGKDAIEAAADVNAANAQFSQTFGDLEGQASTALNSISDDVGISVTRLQGGFTALYAFTKSVGGDSQTALKIAQRAMKAAADSAAYYDRSMEDATETLQSFLKGNYENDAALGIAATETTRNAKANELYAKSFNELTEAQKVDTLLAMVEAGNKASGALGQAAREADSWTNVTGELSEAWRQFLAILGGPVLQGLTPLIQGATEALRQMTEKSSFEQLRADTEAFQEGLANAAAELEHSNAGIEATADLAKTYVKRLEEMEEAGLDTAESQQAYANTVALLNDLIPELNLEIDKTTGSLIQSKDAIYDNIDAYKKMAKEQGRQAYYKKIMDGVADAYESLAEAQVREQELLAKEQLLLDQGAEAFETLSYAEAGSTQALTEYYSQFSDLDRQLVATQGELRGLRGEMDESKAVIAAAEAQIDAAGKVLGDYEDSAAGAAETTGELTDSQEDLAAAYTAAKNAAKASIDSQIGLFQKFKTENDYTAESIIENWERQKQAFVNYEENLKKAVELGLDETLVQQLSDGSQQSMMILDALVNDVDISVDEINAAFGDRMTAEESLSDKLGAMRVIAESEFDLMAEAAKTAGANIVAGVVAGIQKNAWRFSSAMSSMAEAGKKKFNLPYEINSPSRWMEKAADCIVDGAVLQLRRREPDMALAMADLAHAGQAAYQGELDALHTYPSMMAGTPGYGATTNNTRNVAYGGISININTQPGQDSHSIAEAVLDELTVRLGQEEAVF